MLTYSPFFLLVIWAPTCLSGRGFRGQPLSPSTTEDRWWGSNSGRQAWSQAPLTAEPAHQSLFILFWNQLFRLPIDLRALLCLPAGHAGQWSLSSSRRTKLTTKVTIYCIYKFWFIFWGRLSWSPDWPRIHRLAEAGLELLICLWSPGAPSEQDCSWLHLHDFILWRKYSYPGGFTDVSVKLQNVNLGRDSQNFPRSNTNQPGVLLPGAYF